MSISLSPQSSVLLTMRSNRLIIFGVAVFLCLILIAFSVVGILGPFEGIATIPLGFLQGISSNLTQRVTSFFDNLTDVQTLQTRNADLEKALVSFQSEIVELREIKADYQRLAALNDYRGANPDRQYTGATVIARDTTGFLRSITIDRGTRDGIAVGMPVV